MKIGITFDLKADLPASAALPDDWQEEFDSPDTVAAIAAALRDLGHEVVELGDGPGLLHRLLADPPEFVFNIAEGQGVGRSREARVPAVLEMLGIPFTGSDPLTLAVALDKDCARRLVASAGVPVPWGTVIAPDASDPDVLETVRYPAIVKPSWEGSSKGIRSKCLVHAPGELAEVVAGMQHDYRQPLLVEEFIAGDELTVGILGNAAPRVLGIMRVLPRTAEKHFVYSLEVKRDFRRRVRYECPAALDEEVRSVVEYNALLAYQALGCRDVARVDFRLRDGVPYFLEANPLPGLNPDSSDLVILAGMLGVGHDRLVAMILEEAIKRNSHR